MNRFRAFAALVAALVISTAHAGSYEDFFDAISRDDASTITALLQRGFDVNSRDLKGQTALFLAVRDGAQKVSDALLGVPGLDINAVNSAGESALMMAALKGRTEMCRRLLERGAKVNQSGWSPLHYAATSAQPAVVRLLLERGAAVNADSPNHTTPLMMAARYGAEASVDVLLAAGADARRRNDQKLNAADFARLGGREALAARLDKLAV